MIDYSAFRVECIDCKLLDEIVKTESDAYVSAKEHLERFPEHRATITPCKFCIQPH